jgi:hypothetical protein
MYICYCKRIYRNPNGRIIILKERVNKEEIINIIKKRKEGLSDNKKSPKELKYIEERLDSLNKYYDAISDDGVCEVVYKQDFINGEYTGRYTSDIGLSKVKTVDIPKVCNYVLLDIYNCGPCILYQFAKKHNLHSEAIETYCKYRDDILLNNIGKQEFFDIIFDRANCNELLVKEDTGIGEELVNEMRDIKRFTHMLFPTWTSHKDLNVLQLYLQKLETQFIMLAYDYLEYLGVKIHAICGDALLVEYNTKNYYEEIVKKIEQEVERKYKYNIKWVVKFAEPCSD